MTNLNHEDREDLRAGVEEHLTKAIALLGTFTMGVDSSERIRPELFEELAQAMTCIRNLAEHPEERRETQQGAESSIAADLAKMSDGDRAGALSIFLLGCKELTGEQIRRLIYQAITRVNRWDLAKAFDDHATKSLGAVPAEVNYLREIEAAAMEILEQAPDLPSCELTGVNIIAEEAARIFSRVRLILPKADRAQSPVSVEQDTQEDGADGEADEGELARAQHASGEKEAASEVKS